MTTPYLMDAASHVLTRLLGGGGEDGHSEGGHSAGVHITYDDLYNSIVFLVCIYVAGQIASRLLKMPSLVGEIVCGILLGPPLLEDFVPYPEAYVMFGEIGLILLVLEAGIDIDVSTLKLIGTRGMLIALVGSILPIGIGILLAIIVNGTDDIKASIAAGATFGPTSLGIALNILRGGGILNTPVGQLIISAAVIDDMIALIVLSQLESLTGTINAAGILIPVISALAYLIIGGVVALFLVPPLVEKYILSHVKPEKHGRIELAIMFAFLLFMMPATHYSKASPLMGAFVSGLAFCTSHELHVTFVRQFKRVLQWLMRIFFAASIGFQVPIKDFGNGTVIWQGLFFTLALLGKLAVGFMVPNFTQSRKFTGVHLRDCLITGFSMAAEGEFAFVIAVFSVQEGLISRDLYASVVLAVLLSTIIPPFLLRFTISYYNKKAEKAVQELANEEMERNHDLEHDASLTETQRNEQLAGEIRNQRAVFLCIQTQSESRWGLMNDVMKTMAKLGLDVIDHRAWHPRGINTTLVNEIYTKDVIEVTRGSAQESLESRMSDIQKALEGVIKQEDAKIKVQRWYPGVVEEVVENVDEKSKMKGRNVTLEQRLLTEAAAQLDQKQSMQMTATREKTVDEILSSMQAEEPASTLPVTQEKSATTGAGEQQPARRRRRQKMRSTPVVGGGLFGETSADYGTEPKKDEGDKKGGDAKSRKKWKPDFDFGTRSGYRAEIIVEGESYDVRIDHETLKALRTGFSGDMLDSHGVTVSGVSIQTDSGNVTDRLQGYVRNLAGSLGKITEEDESHSETSSIVSGKQNKHDDGDENGALPPV